MKKSGIIAASVAAASATAVASASNCKLHFSHEHDCARKQDDCARKISEKSESQGSASSDKFAPRFDGLRFIETLVTAHR